MKIAFIVIASFFCLLCLVNFKFKIEEITLVEGLVVVENRRSFAGVINPHGSGFSQSIVYRNKKLGSPMGMSPYIVFDERRRYALFGAKYMSGAEGGWFYVLSINDGKCYEYLDRSGSNILANIGCSSPGGSRVSIKEVAPMVIECSTDFNRRSVITLKLSELRLISKNNPTGQPVAGPMPATKK